MIEETTIKPDYEWGSFLTTGSWTLDEGECREFTSENKIRRQKVHELSRELLKKRKFPPFRRLFTSLLKLSSAIVLWYIFDKPRGKEKSRKGISLRLRKRFIALGSTYIKLGQIISSGDSLFPQQLVDEFKLLRDQVPPESYQTVKQTIESDFGQPLESIFSRFEQEPIAAASIAQVHRARLITGQDVVVKVQRSNVSQLVQKDIKFLAWIAPQLVGRIPITALANPPALVEVFTETIIEELDFRLEADNMLAIARVLAETNQRAIIVPRPKLDHVTRRVLVMEEVDGFAFDDVESMKQNDIDTKTLLRAGLVAFTEGALIYGVFHGDLHGGNLMVLKDGTTALLDFGITGRLNESQRRAFMRLIIAGTTGNPHQQITALRDLGAFPKDTDIDTVVDDLGLQGPVKDPTKMNSEELTQEMGDLTKKLLGYGARAPKELMLFVKNLMFLDGATATLAPDIDVLAEIQHVYAYLMSTYGEKIIGELGFVQSEVDLDLNAVRGSLGVADEVDSLTYEDIRKRREIIKKRMIDKVD
ncbi:MAG: AarF/UbiB family protein [Acidimicrobiia bacterium]